MYIIRCMFLSSGWRRVYIARSYLPIYWELSQLLFHNSLWALSQAFTANADSEAIWSNWALADTLLRGSPRIFLKTGDQPNLWMFKTKDSKIWRLHYFVIFYPWYLILKTEDLKTAYLKSKGSKYAFMCWETCLPNFLSSTQICNRFAGVVDTWCYNAIKHKLTYRVNPVSVYALMHLCFSCWVFSFH